MFNLQSFKKHSGVNNIPTSKNIFLFTSKSGKMGMISNWLIEQLLLLFVARLDKQTFVRSQV